MPREDMSSLPVTFRLEPSSRIAAASQLQRDPRDILPTEMWRAALSLAASDSVSVLKPVSLTCRVFRDIAQPIIFRTRSFIFFFPTIDAWVAQAAGEENLEELRRESVSFFAVSQQPHLARLHRHFELLTLSADAVEHPLTETSLIDFTRISGRIRALMTRMVSDLHYFRCLTSVNVGVIDITFPVRVTLSSLSNLRALRLEDCEIIDGDGPVLDIDEYEWCGWGLEASAVPGSPFLVNPSKLTRLSLLGTKETIPHLITQVNAGSSLLSLTTLTIRHLSDDSRDLFLCFLQHVPALSSLNVDAPASFSELRLLRSTIPTLATIITPLFLAPVFVPGRPITFAHFPRADGETYDHERDVRPAMNALAKGSATLTTLYLMALEQPYRFLEEIANRFPRLRNLSMGSCCFHGESLTGVLRGPPSFWDFFHSLSNGNLRLPSQIESFTVSALAPVMHSPSLMVSRICIHQLGRRYPSLARVRFLEREGDEWMSFTRSDGDLRLDPL